MSTPKSTMKAVLFEGKPNHVTVKEVPKPTLQNSKDVIVRVITAGICGTDLHIMEGFIGGTDVPFILGHEAVGIIAEVGNEVQKYQVGDRVVVPDGVFPGLPGPDVPGTVSWGFGNLFGPDNGGCQAEFVRVPFADDVLISIPAGTENELEYALLSDNFATAWGTITATGFQAGDTVAIYGAGPVGLLAAYSALLRGASKVYSIDHVSLRLEKARSIGAIPIDLRQGDPAEQILKLEPAGVRRAADCCGFTCVNTDLKPQRNFILNNAVKVTGVEGGIAFTGDQVEGPRNRGEPKQRPNFGVLEWDMAAWWAKNITINGGIVSTFAQEPALLNLINAGRAKPSFVIDMIINIEDAPEAYRLFMEHKVGKVVIQNNQPISP